MSVISTTQTPFSAHRGVALCAETVSEVSGIQTLSTLASAVTACLEKAFSNMPVGMTTFVQRLEECSGVLSMFSFISTLQWWTNDETPKEEKTWQYTASMICTTVQQMMDVTYVLDEFKVIDLSKVVATVGRIPVLSLVYQTLSLGSTVFSVWNDGVRRAELREEFYKKCLALTKAKDENGTTSNKEKQIIEKLFLENAESQVHEYAKQSLQHRVRVLEVEVSNKSVELTKNKLSIVSNVISIAYGVFALAGILANVAVLSVAGWPMLVLALVSAGVGLHEYLYDKKNPEVAFPEAPVLVTSVDLFNKYMI